jgi:hypothetical protein
MAPVLSEENSYMKQKYTIDLSQEEIRSLETLFKTYLKEREYETSIFGRYEDLRSLNFASFILFLEIYIDKIKKAYADTWDTEMPWWMTKCKEMEESGEAPIKAYEELVKLFTLAGAALETYTQLDPRMWRRNAEDDMKKWKKIEKE